MWVSFPWLMAILQGQCKLHHVETPLNQDVPQSSDVQVGMHWYSRPLLMGLIGFVVGGVLGFFCSSRWLFWAADNDSDWGDGGGIMAKITLYIIIAFHSIASALIGSGIFAGTAYLIRRRNQCLPVNVNPKS